MLSKLLGMFAKDLAMDLGTANTLIFIKGQGVVLNEPSVVALKRDSGKPLAVGHEAKQYLGRTNPSIIAARPLKDGVIADFDMTRVMIREFILKVKSATGFMKPRMLIGVPSGVTQVEKRAVIESAEQAGARDIYLIEEPMAAAIGAGLPIDAPQGCMVVDIGGGTTEVAVISLFSTAYAESVRVAGDEANESIIRYIQKKYQIQIGENTAEQVKISIGSAFPLEQPLSMEVSGKDLLEGIPRTINLTDEEVRQAMAEPVEVILESVKRAFEKTPPELAADVADQGIMLAGGGALIRGLDDLIRHEMKLKVNVAEDPLTCVAMGAGIALHHVKEFRRVFIN
ncbi:MAG: rod shape-determining protein [Desulfarculaceae bacterium]|nr:rod shape-determining protein [Desulfarculaceae bacterium]MCF8072017.1 rod shape-determining protein [Desulfarculaceae bacterium]MCF8101534.1 rod shape-determining protein [Desulfarculaceae bacterium]MCF8115084.1 rod shape-determining protein [Desulfarculaceae bacterium]